MILRCRAATANNLGSSNYLLSSARQYSSYRFLTKPVAHSRLAAPLIRRLHSTTATEPIYRPEVDAENLEGYRPGGYHPALIGDTFCNGRYTVVHKLSFGGYSTIWLAWDRDLPRYVSLKILIADESQSSHESRIPQLLSEGEHESPGKQFIPFIMDEFVFDGPNGQHWGLVGEPAGYSVATSKENSRDLMFPADAARSIAAQLVMGLP